MTKPSPAGRSVSVMVRMTDRGAAYIDKQRGELSRAEFIRQVLAEHAGVPRKPPPSPPEMPPRDLGETVVDALRVAGYEVVKKGGTT